MSIAYLNHMSKLWNSGKPKSPGIPGDFGNEGGSYIMLDRYVTCVSEHIVSYPGGKINIYDRIVTEIRIL